MLPLGPFHTRSGPYIGAPAAGCRAWYRGDGYSGGTWTDRSGNGYHLTAGGAPALIASDANFNGLPSVDFNGTSHYLNGTNLANLIAASAFTIYAVVRAESFGAGNGSASQQRGIFADTTVNASMGAGLGSSKLEIWNYDGSVDYTANPAVSLNTVYGCEFRHAAGTLYGLISGKSEASVASGSTVLPGTSIVVGLNYDLSDYFDGQMAELIFYDTALSSGDRQTTRDYLAETYGLTW